MRRNETTLLYKHYGYFAEVLLCVYRPFDVTVHVLFSG